jgi:hypothetical protein
MTTGWLRRVGAGEALAETAEEGSDDEGGGSQAPDDAARADPEGADG